MPKAWDRASLDKIQQIHFEEYELELHQACNLFLFTRYTGIAFCYMVSLWGNILSKMMGYASIMSTQIYAQITDSKIAKDMDRLIEKFDLSKK